MPPAASGERLRHRPGDPPESEASGPRTRVSGPRTTARHRATRPDSLRRSPPRSDARTGLKSACQRGIPEDQTRTPLRPPPQSARIRSNLANRSAWGPPGTRKRSAEREPRKGIAYPVAWRQCHHRNPFLYLDGHGGGGRASGLRHRGGRRRRRLNSPLDRQEIPESGQYRVLD